MGSVVNEVTVEVEGGANGEEVKLTGRLPVSPMPRFTLHSAHCGGRRLGGGGGGAEASSKRLSLATLPGSHFGGHTAALTNT
ncbi:unnamed protein product [Gadus morhua 'NCC']